MAKRKPIPAYDYRKGIKYAEGTPRCFQPRRGGPPLLFATDIRATILVTLALARGPMRVARLWKHLNKKNVGALRELVRHGLVCRWEMRPSEVYVALDPAHPAARPLRALLLKIARTYDGFSTPETHPDNAAGGAPPVRSGRRRDVRYTFGDTNRTLPLLIVHIRKEINLRRIVWVLPKQMRYGVAEKLWMFHAFGILKRRRVGRGYGFSFDTKHPLTAQIREVLAALDRASPHYRHVAERQAGMDPPPARDSLARRRKRVRDW